ncbi:response regulator, partial [Patescibacteria group bacterium]|nr:response regulator [Patescibacteria group bacterium]
MDKKTILIVEDEEDLAQALKIKLEAAGFITHITSDGESGLQIAFTERPDLILLDILLPGISGVDMLKKLRQYEWGRDVLVILLANVDDLLWSVSYWLDDFQGNEVRSFRADTLKTQLWERLMPFMVKDISEGLKYIHAHKEITNVLLT